MDIKSKPEQDGKTVYSITPVGTGTSTIEIKVHVAHGHHWKNEVWTEPMSAELAVLFARLDKVAAELEEQLKG